jgi:hypothetical protein
MEAPEQKKTWKPVAAGIILLVTGTYGLIRGLAKLVADTYLIGSYFGIFGFETAGVVLVLVSIMCLIGAVFSLRRDLWDVAFAGAVFGLFSSWPLAVMAMVLLVLSKDELL